MSAEAAPKKMVNPLLKLVLEMGPLVLFFLANSRPALFHGWSAPFLPEGIMPEKTAVLTSTGVLMVAVVVGADRLLGADAASADHAGRHGDRRAVLRRADLRLSGPDLHPAQADHRELPVRRGACSAGWPSASCCCRSRSTA